MKIPVLFTSFRPAIAACAILCAAASYCGTAVAAKQAPPIGLPEGYALVWSDEFDVPGLPDASKWDYDTGMNKAGWYNKELQYYARDRAANAVVRDGMLVITARKEDLADAPDWGGQHYSSARLLTRGKADWTYGYFEFRAKLPCGRGTWPAIWTVGSGGRWPEDGELDIMEQIGSRPSRVFSTVHMAAGSGGLGKGAGSQISAPCSSFHTYHMLWTAEDIRFGVDGIERFRYRNPHTGSAAWPFDAPQFLIFNIAIGGVLGGPVDDAIFPVRMEVDYVRIYQASRPAAR